MIFTNYWSRYRRAFIPTQISGCVFWAKSPEGQSYITVGTSSYITTINDASGLNNHIGYNQVNGVALPYHTSSTYPLTGANASSNWRLHPKYSLNTASIPNYFSASMTNSLAAPTGSTFVMIGQRIGDGSENRMHIDCQGSAQGLNGPTYVYPSHKISLLSGGSKQNLFLESSFTFSSVSSSITVISRSIPINKNAPLVIAYTYNQTTRDVNYWINGGEPAQFRITRSVNPMSNSFRHVMTTDSDFTELEFIKYNRELSFTELNQIQNYAIEMYGIVDITNSVTKSWTPLDLPDLKAWFDADHVGYNTSKQIGNWYDLSGNGFDCISNTPILQPEMEVTNSAYGNAALFQNGRKLTSSFTITGNSATELLVAAVYLPIATTTLGYIFSCGNLQNSFAWLTNTVRVNGSGLGTTATYTYTQPSNYVKYYSIVTMSIGQIQTRRPRHIRNGADLTLTQTQNDTTNSILSNWTYTIGGQAAVSSNNMSGSIAELIFLAGTSSFSDQTITNLQTYIVNKHGAFDNSFIWTPALIGATNILYFAQSYTNASGKASAWIDQSVNVDSAVQAATGSQPTIITADPNYNNKDVLDFDSSVLNLEDYMVTSTVTGGNNVVTVAWIGHADSVSGVRKIWETGGAAGGHAGFVEGSKLSVTAVGASGQDYVAGNTTIVVGTRYLFVVEIPFSTLTTDEIRSWVNNVQQTQTVIGNTATNTTMNSSTWTISKWTLSNLQHWDGRMAFLGAWAGALTTVERNSLYTWAQAQYNVA